MWYSIAVAGCLLFPPAGLAPPPGRPPVAVGMTRAEVELRLGPPQNGYERLGDPHDPLVTAFYLTPRLQVSYWRGRVTGVLLPSRPQGDTPQP